MTGTNFEVTERDCNHRLGDCWNFIGVLKLCLLQWAILILVHSKTGNCSNLYGVSFRWKINFSRIELTKATKQKRPDNPSARVLFGLRHAIAKQNGVVFELSWYEVEIPSDRKNAKIPANFKRVAKSDPNSYTTASLNTTCCKVAETTMGRRSWDFWWMKLYWAQKVRISIW